MNDLYIEYPDDLLHLAKHTVCHRVWYTVYHDAKHLTWPSMYIGKNELEQISIAFKIGVYTVYFNYDNSQHSFSMLFYMAILKYWSWWSRSDMLLLQSKYGIATANRYTDRHTAVSIYDLLLLHEYIYSGRWSWGRWRITEEPRLAFSKQWLFKCWTSNLIGGRISSGQSDCAMH